MEIPNRNGGVRILVPIGDVPHYIPGRLVARKTLNVFFLKTPYATKIVFLALHRHLFGHIPLYLKISCMASLALPELPIPMLSKSK